MYDYEIVPSDTDEGNQREAKLHDWRREKSKTPLA